jgi:hypothetical protein
MHIDRLLYMKTSDYKIYRYIERFVYMKISDYKIYIYFDSYSSTDENIQK